MKGTENRKVVNLFPIKISEIKLKNKKWAYALAYLTLFARRVAALWSLKSATKTVWENRAEKIGQDRNVRGIPVPIPGIPGNSGNGNERSQNLRNSRNSPFPGNGNQFNWESRDSPAGNKIPFFLSNFDFLNNKYFIKNFYQRKKNCLVSVIVFYFIIQKIRYC